MYKVQEIYNYLDSLYPFSGAAEWDNAGLLVGNGGEIVTKIAVALDITSKTVSAAADMGCELIVSHHPVIFRTLKNIKSGSAPYLLVRHGISAICAHTNLDAAKGGVNDVLAKILGLREIKPVRDESEAGMPALGRAGKLPQKMTPKELAEHVKSRLGCGRVCFTDSASVLSTAAVCSGSGSPYYLDYCIENGIDALITGEVKHHEYLAAAEAGLVLIDAGHFCTERIICGPLAAALRERFGKAEVIVIDESEPYITI